MAEIITAKGTGFFIEKVIRGARESIVLISPYLKVQKLYLDELKAAAKRGIAVAVVFREDEAKQDQVDALLEVKGIKLYQLPELHAKCYFNEHRFVLTSMNLHDHSERNNKELGIMLEQAADAELFAQAHEQAMSILAIAQPLKSFTSNGAEAPPVMKRVPGTAPQPSTGYCIRTGEPIPFNVEKPLSYPAFQVWSQFGDPDYPEKYCHFSGEPSHGDTCVARPILKKNWKKAKAAFGL